MSIYFIKIVATLFSTWSSHFILGGNMKRKLWTLLFLLMTTFGTLVVTGCGSSLTTYFTSDLPKSLNERGQANKDRKSVV